MTILFFCHEKSIKDLLPSTDDKNKKLSLIRRRKKTRYLILHFLGKIVQK